MQYLGKWKKISKVEVIHLIGVIPGTNILLIERILN